MPGITLKAVGRHDKVTLEEAQAYLTQFEHELNQAGDDAKVETLDISCRVWQAETLAVLADFFSTRVAPTLVHLQMDDIIATLPTDEGLATIQALVDMFQSAVCLETIHAADNALGERAAALMGPLLVLPAVRYLSFENCGMSTAVGRQLCAAILQDRTSTPLTHLYMGRNAMQVEGALQVARIVRVSPKLQVFKYNGSRPLKQGTKALMEAFDELAASREELPLVELDLNDCSFGTGQDEQEDSLDALIQVLQKCPHLRHLNLSEGIFGPTGTAKVLTAIQTAGARLQSFGLGGVNLREDEAEEGVEALLEFLESSVCAGLEKLTLDNNELEDEGTTRIVEALANLHVPLKELSLESNLILDDGAQALLDHKIPTLQKLNLLDNEIPTELANELVRLYKGCQIIFDDDIEIEAPEEPEQKDVEVDALADAMAAL